MVLGKGKILKSSEILLKSQYRINDCILGFYNVWNEFHCITVIINDSFCCTDPRSGDAKMISQRTVSEGETGCWGERVIILKCTDWAPGMIRDELSHWDDGYLGK